MRKRYRGLSSVSSNAICKPDFMDAADIVSSHDGGMTIGSQGAARKWTTLPSRTSSKVNCRPVAHCRRTHQLTSLRELSGIANLRGANSAKTTKSFSRFRGRRNSVRSLGQDAFTARTDTPLDDIEARHRRRLRNFARQFRPTILVSP